MSDGDQDRTSKLALLIDAENIRVEFLPVVLREASALGTITVRRIYGHFAGDQMKSWHQAIHDHALTPVHVPPRAKGKNAADMKLAVDAIDLLHQKRFDGFCIASSDSDFTTLANRIREDGLTVFGPAESALFVDDCPSVFRVDTRQMTEAVGSPHSAHPIARRILSSPRPDLICGRERCSWHGFSAIGHRSSTGKSQKFRGLELLSFAEKRLAGLCPFCRSTPRMNSAKNAQNATGSGVMTWH
jgi:hypothetical protein